MGAAHLSGLVRAAELALDAGGLACARTAAMQAAALAREQGDEPLLGRALLLCGRASYLDAQYELAYAAAFEACVLLRADGDITRALCALNVIVAVHQDSDDWGRAAEQARWGIDLAVRHGEHEMTARLLHRLGCVLYGNAEYPESLRCIGEAIGLHGQRPQALPGHLARCATELALVRFGYSRHLAAQGRAAEAHEQLQAARAALPAHPPAVDGTASIDVIATLENRVHLQAVWNDRDGARASAALFLKIARRRNGSRRHLGAALNALSTLHACAGNTARAIHWQQRSLAVLRQMEFTAAVSLSARTLAQIQARLGRYADAIAWHQEAARVQARATLEKNALRSRLAMLERQAHRSHGQAHEALLHTQRVMVLGRLISQIQHAMVRPLLRTHQRIVQSGEALRNGAEPARVSAHLQHSIQQTDLAAALAQQLKLFSYRATPQESALLLDGALQTAWDGLLLYGRLHGWSLSITCDAVAMEVRADPQRLGILLKELLVGLTQQRAYHQPGRVLWATVEHAAGDMVALTIGVSGHQGIACRSDDGIALCIELAQEMGGQFARQIEGGLVRGYRLSLPCANNPTHTESGTG
jgi:tetratricopeptide (TPR) repeat protein